MTLPQVHRLVCGVIPQRTCDTHWVLAVVAYWQQRNSVAYRAQRKRRIARSISGSEVSLVPVQIVKTALLRLRLLVAYPVAMETPAALPPDIWERTPHEAQAYMRALEARVAT